MKIALIASSLVLGACAIPIEQQLASFPDHRLCWDTVYSSPRSIQELARREVARRGVVCTPELIAAYQREREFQLRERAINDANTNAAIDTIIRARQPAPMATCVTTPAGSTVVTTCR